MCQYCVGTLGTEVHIICGPAKLFAEKHLRLFWNWIIGQVNLWSIQPDNLSRVWSVPLISVLHLTNRFHIAVHLFSNWSQMMSKCSEQETGGKAIRRVFHWCSYHIWTSFGIYYGTDALQYGIYLFYKIKKQKMLRTSSIHLCSNWS